MGNTLTINLDGVRLSPSELLTLQNLVNRQPKPTPVTQGVQQAIDETFGKPERK
jgi:hypothetical protein